MADTDLLTAPQKNLWVTVYGAAYAHLTARAAACFVPTENHRQFGPSGGINVPDAHEYASREADRAVTELKARSLDG